MVTLDALNDRVCALEALVESCDTELIFTRVAKPIGNGAYVPINRKYLGRTVTVIVHKERK